MSNHHSSGRLPWELYDLVCLHSSRSDQTRLLRVCHQFFDITVPHLWREVSLLPLLLLLESKTRTAPSGNDEANPPPPTKPPAKSLVERLRSYGKHVEHFTIHSFETGRADSPEDPYQSILTSAGFSEVMLPRLKSLSLNFATPPNFYRTETWIVVFVPTTIRELTLRAQNPQDTRLVQPLHSRFTGITRFELQLPEMPEATSWEVFDRNQPLPALEEVKLECHKLDRPVLKWASRLSNIRTLRLNFHGGSLISSRLFSRSNPYSFPSLESIYVRITESSWHLIEQFWQSPLVSNVTRVVLSGSSMVGSSPDLDAELFSALATHSPKLNYLEMHESGQATEDFGIPILLLLILSPLPLRVFRIPRPIARDHGSNILETVSKLWPDIEELLLPGTQVEQQELLELPRYLPRVRHFHFSMLQEWVYDDHILRGILGRHSFCALDSGHCACLRAPDVWCDRAAT